MTVGTPAQAVTVYLDTIASFTYFDALDSKQCQNPYGAQQTRLCAGGSFQTNFSSTYHSEVSGGFNCTEDGTVIAAGDLATDIVQLDDVQISNVRFGIAENSIAESGSLGLGYGLNYLTQTDSPYRSILAQLQDANIIQSKLYSLFLNESGASTGNIIFGGVDFQRFSGPLVAVDFLASDTDWQGTQILSGGSNSAPIIGVTQPMVAVTDIGIAFRNGTQTQVYTTDNATGQTSDSLPSILDVSDPWWSVSNEVYGRITPSIPGLNASSGVIDCESASESINITVGIAKSITIDVPLKNLVIPVFNAQTNVQNTTADGLPLCLFAMYAANASLSNPYFLGSSVMQAMYLVFDLDNAQVSIASPLYNSSFGYSIAAIPAGPNGISKALQSGYYSTVSALTAPSNRAMDVALITATGSPGSNTPVGRTTSTEVGQNLGTAAIPQQGKVTSQVILSSGTLGLATTSTAPAASTTANATATATHSGAIDKLQPPMITSNHTGWVDLVVMTGFLSAIFVL